MFVWVERYIEGGPCVSTRKIRPWLASVKFPPPAMLGLCFQYHDENFIHAHAGNGHMINTSFPEL